MDPSSLPDLNGYDEPPGTPKQAQICVGLVTDSDPLHQTVYIQYFDKSVFAYGP